MTNYSLSSQLIQLEKEDQLLLMDGSYVMPLLIHQGKGIIKDYLAFCGKTKDKKAILEAYPDRSLFDALISHGILQPENDKNKTGSMDFVSCNDSKRQDNQKLKHISLYLLLTQYCNLGCIYCFNGDSTYQRKNRLKMKERVAVQAVLRHLDMLAPGGTLEIVFFGGEPLLNWPLVKKVIQFCESKLKDSHRGKNWKYHLTTNLTFLPKDLVEWAKRYHLDFLIDVDGPEDIHNRTRPAPNQRFNSYQATAKNIGRLVRAGIRPALRATIVSHNVENMAEISKIHKSLGGKATALMPLIPVNSDEIPLPVECYPEPQRYGDNLKKALSLDIWDFEDFFPLKEFLSKIHPHNRTCLACGAPSGRTPTVDVNGDVYACIYLVGSPRYYLGNIFEPKYPRRQVLTDLAAYLDVDHNPVCAQCAYRYICGGGCPVRRLSVEDNRRTTPALRHYAREVACVESITVINHLLWKLAEQASKQFTQDNQPPTQTGRYCL